jgi:hypothetical protein
VTAAPSAPVVPWTAASADLAARVTRRAQAGAALPRVAAGLGGGALLSIALKATVSFPGAPAVATTLQTLSAAVGLVLGTRAAARVARTAPGDAAWALDRLAHARERGLTAATATGPAAAEAAWSSPPLAPPAVRLRPPAGLAATIAASLLVVVASLWPVPATAGPAPRAGAVRRAAAGSAAAALEAARAEAEVREAQRAAEAETALRESLGLSPAARPEAAQLLPRLASPEDREAARRAAPPGSDLERALASGDPAAAAAAAAKALGAGAVDRSADLRREAAELRAGAGVVPVPPGRRDLVERWFAARAAAAPAGGGAR